MLIDHTLRPGAVLVKTWDRHLLLEIFYRPLALGDLVFELLDFRVARLFGALTLAGFGVGAFLLVMVLPVTCVTVS